MKVVIEGNEFTLVDVGQGSWEVFADGKDPIGTIRKSFRTRTVGRGIRQTKKVPCWQTSNSPAGSGRSFKTRKDAILDLVGAAASGS